MRRPRRLLVFVLAGATIAVTVPVALAATTVITISGATASFPLVELLTHSYSKLQHNKIKFSVSQGGASVGIADVAAGKVNIGDSSRGPQSTDPSGLDFYPIAKYFVCVVTSKSNPISNLTPAQAEAIFEGKVRNWGQVSGSSLNTTIDVDSRTSVAGVLTTFQNTLLAGGKVASLATQYASEGELQTAVEKDPNAIGFLSDYFALNKNLNAVAYNGTACSVANTVNETYPGWSFFYEVTKGPQVGNTIGHFINWIQTSKAAKKLIETNWIPLTVTKPTAG